MAVGVFEGGEPGSVLLDHRLLRFDKFPAGERERNILPDIPIRYGKPPEWRFYKNLNGKDLAAVPREELRSAIR